MVWDGLRPDSVTQHDTPNLFTLEREGVRFARHHSQYPTLTMVNAATLATGAPPGVAGIFGDEMFLGPTLKDQGVNLQGDGLMQFAVGPAMLEDTKRLADLNAPDALKGNLLGLDSVVQEAAREGGYVAVVGKEGPTYLFDDRVLTVAGGQDEVHAPHANYLFLTDDTAAPPAERGAVRRCPAEVGCRRIGRSPRSIFRAHRCRPCDRGGETGDGCWPSRADRVLAA